MQTREIIALDFYDVLAHDDLTTSNKSRAQINTFPDRWLPNQRNCKTVNSLQARLCEGVTEECSSSESGVFLRILSKNLYLVSPQVANKMLSQETGDRLRHKIRDSMMYKDEKFYEIVERACTTAPGRK